MTAAAVLCIVCRVAPVDTGRIFCSAACRTAWFESTKRSKRGREMLELRIRYKSRGDDQIVDYTEGEVDPFVERLFSDGLGQSSVSLMLRLVSAFEELALHEENGFLLETVKRR